MGAFLDAGAHVNLRQLDDDLSPLDLASSGGHAVTMTRLLEHGARVNARDSEGETALLKAARNGQDSAVEVLIRAGADVNVPDSYGRTPLHFAAETLVMKSAEALLPCGARVNARDSWGRSPLLRAAGVSRDDSGAQMIDFLLRWGADESVGDVDGRIPVQVLGFYERQRVPNTPIDTYARHLLVNASAWRRRRVPVMSRARLFKERGGADGASRRARDNTEARKRARLTGVEEGGRGAERASLADDAQGVVEKVVGTQEEGVFRHVVTFL